MNFKETIAQLICLPRKLAASHGESIHTLLANTGYFEVHSQITEHDIREELARHPDCIDDWLLFSEDKRSSSGAYFLRVGKGSYEVGLIPANEGDAATEFADALGACVVFIKRELEDIRKHSKSKKSER